MRSKERDGEMERWRERNNNLQLNIASGANGSEQRWNANVFTSDVLEENVVECKEDHWDRWS